MQQGKSGCWPALTGMLPKPDLVGTQALPRACRTAVQRGRCHRARFFCQLHALCTSRKPRAPMLWTARQPALPQRRAHDERRRRRLERCRRATASRLQLRPLFSRLYWPVRERMRSTAEESWTGASGCADAKATLLRANRSEQFAERSSSSEGLGGLGIGSSQRVIGMGRLPKAISLLLQPERSRGIHPTAAPPAAWLPACGRQWPGHYGPPLACWWH